MPLLFVGYAISYIDRLNLSFAALQMNQDLHFSATIYGIGSGLFFLSYSLLEIPSNLMLLRFGARRWITRIMISWGLIATCMMFAKTPIEFYLMRFLLGAAEVYLFCAGLLFSVSFYHHDDRKTNVTPARPTPFNWRVWIASFFAMWRERM